MLPAQPAGLPRTVRIIAAHWAADRWEPDVRPESAALANLRFRPAGAEGFPVRSLRSILLSMNAGPAARRVFDLLGWSDMRNIRQPRGNENMSYQNCLHVIHVLGKLFSKLRGTVTHRAEVSSEKERQVCAA